MGHLRLTEKNWEKQFLIKVRHCQINYVELLKIKKKIQCIFTKISLLSLLYQFFIQIMQFKFS
jgi:hypothetical protein